EVLPTEGKVVAQEIKEILEEKQAAIAEVAPKMIKETITQTTKEVPSAVLPAKTTTTIPVTLPGSAAITSAAASSTTTPSIVKTVKELVVSTAADNLTKGLTEGDKIQFTAYLLMSDGSKVRVREGITWKVVGLIGDIDSNGVFVAKLDPSIAEYGEGFGAVAAIYKDYMGKTEIFKVVPYIDPAALNMEGNILESMRKFIIKLLLADN
ncbi:MAG: hypothetical protein V1856_03385, partial [Candidatus Liptonbacteria bacterium]